MLTISNSFDTNVWEISDSKNDRFIQSVPVILSLSSVNSVYVFEIEIHPTVDVNENW